MRHLSVLNMPEYTVKYECRSCGAVVLENCQSKLPHAQFEQQVLRQASLIAHWCDQGETNIRGICDIKSIKIIG